MQHTPNQTKKEEAELVKSQKETSSATKRKNSTKKLSDRNRNHLRQKMITRANELI